MAGRVQYDISGAHNGIAINLAADTVLPSGCRGIHIGGTGDVKVDFVGGATGIVLKGLIAGWDYAYQVSKVYSTANGTSATDLVALY